MLVKWKSVNGTHSLTVQCIWGSERKRRWLASEEEEREVTTRAFRAYGLPLEIVTSLQ